MENTQTEQKVNGQVVPETPETAKLKKLAAIIAEEVPAPKLKLVQKLAEVMAAVGYIQKTGNNVKQNYKYAKEADVVAAIRPELAKRNIFIFPNVISVQRNKVERLDFDKALKFSWATDILVEWTIEDGDSGETRKCIIPGCSESPGDKGVYVAMTGSEKYLLMKGFLLPTGDDPEADEHEEKGSKEAAQAVGQKKIEDFKQKMGNGQPPKIDGMVVDHLTIYYTWYDASQTALITLTPEMLEKHKKVIHALTTKVDGKLIADGEQLSKLEYEFEKIGVPFKKFKTVPVKAAGA